MIVPYRGLGLGIKRALEEWHEVNRRTLQRDLKAMIDKGLISEKASSPTDPTKHYLIVESRLK
jgi:DNA-binding HxlR family transcriptional regulator